MHRSAVLVAFADFPDAQTFGDDIEDAVATVVEAYIKDRRPLPEPSAGRRRLEAPALLLAKARLYELMLHDRVTKSELGRRLDVHLPQVDRLLDVHHGSQLDRSRIRSACSANGWCSMWRIRRAMSSHREGAPIHEGKAPKRWAQRRCVIAMSEPFGSPKAS